MHEGRDVLDGQSWQRGQVIVAWDAVRDGAADPHDGTNVVIHEFAHQLDQRHRRRQWCAVCRTRRSCSRHGRA